MAVLGRQLEQFDHLPGAALLAMTFDERLPDAIKTRGPSTGLPSLFQWLRSSQCARLAIQHVEIMFEIEDLLLPALTSFVPSDTPAVVPKFDRAGIHFRLHLGARRQRDRVCIREDDTR